MDVGKAAGKIAAKLNRTRRCIAVIFDDNGEVLQECELNNGNPSLPEGWRFRGSGNIWVTADEIEQIIDERLASEALSEELSNR